MAVKYFFIAVLLCGVAFAQENPKISEAISSLSPELQDKINQLQNNINDTQIQEIKNKSMEAFREKCEKNGGPGSFETAQSSTMNVKTCLESLVNTTELQEEIAAATPTGQVDEVFKKYCSKSAMFKSCFRNMTESVRPCFSADERNNLKVIYNVSEQLADFICFKDGDRIALFIAEGGRECIEDNQEAINQCVNTTLGPGENFDVNSISASSIPKISFGEKECGQMNALEACVVDVLVKCPTPTTANIVESLFKFARQATPCIKFTKAKPGNGAPAAALAVTFATQILALLALSLV